MYCENTKQNERGQMEVVNPLNVFQPAFVPGMFSFSVVFGLLDLDPSEKDYVLQVQFKGPNQDDQPIVDSGPIVLQRQPEMVNNGLPKEARGMVGNMDFRNAVLREEGYYVTEVYVDHEKIGEVPIYVKGGGL